MKTFWNILFFLSGAGFLFWGIKAIQMSVRMKSPSEEMRKEDRALGEAVYRESIARGDEEWMASFHKSDTEYMSDDFYSFRYIPLLMGIASVLASLLIFSVWWFSISNLLTRV